MASAADIKLAIKNRVESSKVTSYASWTIGITTDPKKRKEEHGLPKHWIMLEADSLAVAREVETYFLNEFPKVTSERMQGGTGGDMDGKKMAYVYIF